MARKALTDEKHEKIMAHILDPEHSPLPAELKDQLDRVVSVSKLLDNHKTIKNAVALHMSKYKEISRATAYRDIALARRVYNSTHEFDFDYYRMWLINDIIENIERCRNKNSESYQYSRVIAMEHANLLKAIGEKPEELPDPKRQEKHNFFLMININGESVKVDFNKLHELPNATIRELNRILMGGREIDEQGAVEIMES